MSGDATGISERLGLVQRRIEEARRRSGRTDEVVLIAVSKTRTVEEIHTAYGAGQHVFGENYAQELLRKAEALHDLPDIHWRFIGHLQRNKVKAVLRAGATIDTVDSVRLADAIAAEARKLHIRAPVSIQLNIDDEPQKYGCRPTEAAQLADHIRTMDTLELRGLLVVPAQASTPELTRPAFQAARKIASECGISVLSMGMTQDFEVAVEEGAHEVRVGTAIFGPRS